MLRPAPSLTRLLNPRSVAVIGGRIAESVALELKKLGFDGDIWPVNPKRETMAGLACFASLDDLPGSPDATYIGLAREAAVDAVRQFARHGRRRRCGSCCRFFGSRRGWRQAVRCTCRSGRPDAGDRAQLLGRVEHDGAAALWPDYHGLEPVERGVAILAQSGNMAINFTMQARALPIAMVITVGNQTVTGVNDLLEHLIDDDRITAIGIHTEGLPDTTGFPNWPAGRTQAGKPIVALKTGASEKGARATVSHTATLAGRDDLYDALFARTGVARVRSVPAFLETLKLLSMGGALPTGRITSLSCSGGEASLMADSAAHRPHLALPDLSEAETRAVRATLNEYVDVTNPLDYHTFIWADFDRMRATYAAMMQVAADMHCLVFDIPRADRADTAQYDIALDAWIAAAADTGSRAAVVATMGECLPEATAQRLVKAGIVPFFGVEEALDALNAAATIGRCTQPTAIRQPMTAAGAARPP
jgi:acyl-CoA synthetase (NDP forming)